jgi:hypothetical protein
MGSVEPRYEHLKVRGTNKARVAIAGKTLTIAFQILRDQCAHDPRGTPVNSRVRRRYPGCPDELPASPPRLACAPQQ